MNDNEREQWVLNDDYLYEKSGGKGIMAFVKQNRQMIDAFVKTYMDTRNHREAVVAAETENLKHTTHR